MKRLPTWLEFFFSASIGWYLMVPPSHSYIPLFYKILHPFELESPEHWTVDMKAPLSKWEQLGSYSRLKECQADLASKMALNAQMISVDSKLPKDNALEERMAENALNMVNSMTKQLNAALCIASDDPRLK